jgi:hypothetical protein
MVFWNHKRHVEDAAAMHEIIHRAEEAQDLIELETPGILERSVKLGVRLRENHLGPALTIAFQRRGSF